MLNQLIQHYQGTLDIGALFIACFLFPFICVALWELVSKLIKSEQPQSQQYFTYSNYYNPREAITFEIKK